MRNKLIIILSLLIMPLVIAQPVINSVTGELVDNNTITVTGSGFGLKSSSTPLLWEDFDDGEDGSVLSSTNKWIISSDNTLDKLPQFSRANTRSGSGGQAFFTYPVCCEDYQRDSARVEGLDISNGDKMVASMWVKSTFTGAGVYGPDNPKQWKMWNFLSGPYNVDSYPSLYWNWGGAGAHITYGAAFGGMIPPAECDTGSYPGWNKQQDYTNEPIPNEWNHLMIVAKTESSEVACDGELQIYFNGQYYSGRGGLSMSGDNGYLGWDIVQIGHYIQSNMNEEYYVWVDDLYVDDSWARIEIGNAPTYESVTKREIQIPMNNWQDDSLEFEAKLTSFTQQEIDNGLYLFVVDENNVASEGFLLNSQPACEATVGNCYYVSPTGSDSNDGSFENPFASIKPFVNNLVPGDFVYFRGGNYGVASKGGKTSQWNDYEGLIALESISGTAQNPITFKAYPGELPVVDLYLMNPDFDPLSHGQCAPDDLDYDTCRVTAPEDAIDLQYADYIVIDGFEIVHGAIDIGGSDHTWILNNHVHDSYLDRDNHGLIRLYFTNNAYVINNTLHDAYSRTVKDENGEWVLNTWKSHWDTQHNGCLTTLSGESYGNPHEAGGPHIIDGNTFRDCPAHFFFKNGMGSILNENGYGMEIRNNHFLGAGMLSWDWRASHVLFENNLVEIPSIYRLGGYPDRPEMHELAARDVTIRNNVFTGVPRLVGIYYHGHDQEAGPFSTSYEDKLKIHNNIVFIEDPSSPSSIGQHDLGIIVHNNKGQDTVPVPSKTLSRIDSMNNCYINSRGDGIAFFKQWVSATSDVVSGVSVQDAINLYNINGQGDLYPTDTNLESHFNDIYSYDFSVKASSPCALIPNVGLINPAVFFGAQTPLSCNYDGTCDLGESSTSCPNDCSIPAVCGDDVIEGNEECEPSLALSDSCQSLNEGFVSGSLSCNPLTCQYDTSSCVLPVCGDGVIEGNEECDSSNLNSQSCFSLGFDEGSLSCNPSTCEFDVSSCVSTELIIDDGEAGTSYTGSWSVGGAGPDWSPTYNDDHHISSIGAGNTYSWTASLPIGEYELFAWWLQYSSRPTDIFYDVSSDLGSFSVGPFSQKVGKNQWNLLGTFNLSGEVVVTVNSGSDGTSGTVADAVRFVKVGDLNSKGPSFDFDTDGDIDLNDLYTLAQRFGQSYSQGDYDNDGKITIIDILTHINNWN